MTQPTDKAGFQDMWRRLFPADYTDSLEQGDGRGADIAAAQAAIFARVSTALNVTTQAYYIRVHSTQTGDEASGATQATGTVYLSRLAPADYDVTLVAGTRFLATMVGTRGQTLEVGEAEVAEDTTLPAGMYAAATGASLAVPARAVLSGYAFNFPEGRIAGFSTRGRASVQGTVVDTTRLSDLQSSPYRTGDVFSLAQAGQYVRLLGLTNHDGRPRRIVQVVPGIGTAPSVATIEPALNVLDVGSFATFEVEEFSEIGLVVAQRTAFTGGRDGELEAAAADRDLSRTIGESDVALVERVASLNDVVSPSAIVRACNRALLPYGIRFRLLEARDMDTLRGFFYDLDALDFGSWDAIPKLPGSELVGEGAVLLSASTSKHFFVILVSSSGLGEFGFGYDSPIVPNTNALDNDVFLDGYPVTYNGIAAALDQQLRQIKAGGVAYMILRDQTI